MSCWPISSNPGIVVPAPYAELKELIENSEDEAAAVIERSTASQRLKQLEHKEVIRFSYPGVQEELILKVICPKGRTPLRKFFRRFKKSSCLVEYQKTLHFHNQGVRVVVPILAGEKRRFGLLRKGYYLAPIISGTMLLRDYLAGVDTSRTEQVKDKRTVVKLLGREIGRMHRKFLYHGDPGCANILIKKDASAHQVFLIDCGLARICNKSKAKFIRRDLHRLRNSIRGYQGKGIVTNADLLRFSKAYCRFNPQLTPKGLLDLLN
jgi:tRNA A-37 threonylcarbamoyl transferase component Bud32